ncbi:MAG: ribonuclease Z, partial [Acidobacteriia bacterium]|nr:ribonuclease Z [Terriglobia bacterium]
MFMSSLLNGLTGDPGLWVDLLDEGRSLLFDLGDLRRVASRKLLRVERAVVTHTHMDHFVGFDHLLRLTLGREKELTVTGPPGFLRSVQGKIEAYTWNLIEEYPIRLVAEEVDGNVVRAVRFTGPGRMIPEPLPDRPFTGTLHAERLYTMHAAIVDHGIPVLAVALRETEHISVNRDRLERLGLAPGSWLRDLKQAVRRCEPADAEIRADTQNGDGRTFRRGDLADEIILHGPGQRVAYVTDLGFTPENFEAVAALARDADLLVCEAAFLHED